MNQIAIFLSLTAAALTLRASAENTNAPARQAIILPKPQIAVSSNHCDKATSCKSMPSKRALLSPKATAEINK